MNNQIIISGIGIGNRQGRGRVLRINSYKEFDKIKGGEVVVTAYATPDYILILNKVGCLVTDAGGVTSHIAIVCRELSASAIIGTGDATKYLTNGLLVSYNTVLGKIKLESHI